MNRPDAPSFWRVAQVPYRPTNQTGCPRSGFSDLGGNSFSHQPSSRTTPGRCILTPMAERLVRYQQTGDMHFLTFSCYHRLPYLASPQARDLFESALERIRQKYKFVVAGYVVMPEPVSYTHLRAHETVLDL